MKKFFQVIEKSEPVRVATTALGPEAKTTRSILTKIAFDKTGKLRSQEEKNTLQTRQVPYLLNLI